MIKLEFVTFILALFMSVVSGAGVLFCVGVIMYYHMYWSKKFERDHFDNEMDKIVDGEGYTSDIYSHMISLALLTLFGLDLAMNAFLAEGVYKMKTGQLRAYLIYGVLKTTIFMAAAIGLLYFQYEMAGATVLLISATYSTILYLVLKTMQKFSDEKSIPMIEKKPLK